MLQDSGRMYVLLPMAAGFQNRPLLLHSSVLLQMQQEINFVLQHCKQCWIIIMDFVSSIASNAAGLFSKPAGYSNIFEYPAARANVLPLAAAYRRAARAFAGFGAILTRE
jgi:hypothetical protein